VHRRTDRRETRRSLLRKQAPIESVASPSASKSAGPIHAHRTVVGPPPLFPRTMGNDSDLPLPKTGEPSTGNLASKNEVHEGVKGAQPSKLSASSTSDQGLSKNQLKKRKRWQKQLELKRRRKEQEREVKRQKAKRDGRDLDKERAEQAERERDGTGKRKRDEKWQQRMLKADSGNSFRVCFDCSFEDKMTSKEINSLSLQLRYVYAANKRSDWPVYVDVCGMNRQTQGFEILNKVEGFPEQWSKRAFGYFESGLEEVYSRQLQSSVDTEQSKKISATDQNDDKSSQVCCDVRAKPESGLYPSMKPGHRLVYLTGDSPNLLSTLDNNTTYIVGGIVDRNRLKRLAISRAELLQSSHPKLNITTARLPLDEHVNFKGVTRILTCNHVFDILQKYRENGYTDWKKAIMTVLPDRKELEEKPCSKDDGKM